MPVRRVQTVFQEIRCADATCVNCDFGKITTDSAQSGVWSVRRDVSGCVGAIIL